ncbi:hypothetical protein [Pelomonas sp. SE-A7]|uniref:hypothetical protein n=1 Tax=Pelomonas sp. SE-A7 TaxID=3054953 RepID=UPI00259CD05D|nr:hypothetical protein [Pelomonas sp. SE-A7]MDM4768307.1 hypothetical protein [Pelomonas sp. SE-A7]
MTGTVFLADSVLAKDRVTWLAVDTVDQHQSGSRPSVPPHPGPGEQARIWLEAHLPDFDHGHDRASVARIERQIEGTGATYCYANALRTPARESYGLFSDAVLHRLPPRLILRKDRLGLLAPHLNSAKQVVVSTLVNDAKLRGAVTLQRNYGTGIDNILAGTKGLERVSAYSTPSRMLSAGRVDWIIAEPVEHARALQAEPGTQRISTRSFEIAGQVMPVVSYVMCNRTPTARKLIAQLNSIMAGIPERPWERPYLEQLDAHERADLARMTMPKSQ